MNTNNFELSLEDMQIINNNIDVKCIIHTGDMHLKDGDGCEEFSENFDKLLDNIENSIEDDFSKDETLIVIAGDYFDNHSKTIKEETLLTGIECFTKILKRGFRLLVTIGNHDYDRKNIAAPDYITPVAKILESMDDLYYKTFAYHTFSFMKNSGYYITRDVVFVHYSVWQDYKMVGLEEMRLKHPTKKFIGIFHGCVKKATDFKGYDLTENHTDWIDPAIFEGCDAVIMADIHNPQEIENEFDIPMIYCGSPWQLNFGESISRHYFVKWNLLDGIDYEFIKNAGTVEKHKYLYEGDKFTLVNK